VLASMDRLAGKKTTSEDEEAFKDALWTYVARFKYRRTRIITPITSGKTTKEGMMRFAHSISTDGYSVTLVCNNENIRGRRQIYRSGASSRKTKKKFQRRSRENSLY